MDIDLSTAKFILLPIHGIFGALALFFGAIALRSKKTKGRHTKHGSLFVVMMLVAIAVSIPVIVLSKNIFLAGLGAVALYLVLSGWRIGKLRPPAGQPGLIDWTIMTLFLIVFLVYVGFGLWAVIATGQSLGLVAIFLGGLGAKSVWDHLRFFRHPEESAKGWMTQHGQTMGGAFIASVTAFFAAAVTNFVTTLPGLDQVPEFVVWLAPVLLLIPVLNRQIKRGRGA